MLSIYSNFLRLKVWTRASKNALSKPLLILFAIGRLSRGLNTVPFKECEEELKNLIREFGNDTSHPEPRYPFWRLQNDGVWTVSGDFPITQTLAGDVSVLELRNSNAVGRFADAITKSLVSDPESRSALVNEILEAYFPSSLHNDLLSSIQFLEYDLHSHRKRRDPNFRKQVLSAYRYQCAICLQDMRLKSMTIGLEAAHIKWHQANGPDSIENGLCLCSIHHKLFDLGAFTIDQTFRIIASEHVTGSNQVTEILLKYHGNLVAKPIHSAQVPNPEYLKWHSDKIFKHGALPLI